MSKISLAFLYLIIIFLGLNPLNISAADTLKISIKEADSLFLKTNFKLLASSMNISAQKAQIIQAKLYPNPIFTADVNAYDPDSKKAFHVDQTGQKAFQLEQLILLGGKRKTQVDMAKTNVKIAELEFQQLVSQLKFQLHSSLYFLKQQTILINKYNKQLNLLDTILSVYEVQVKKGNIALKDLVRIKGFYLAISNERSDLYKNYFDEMAKVQTILQTNLIINLNNSDNDYESFIKLISSSDISNIAFENRADYLITQQDKILADQYFTFQKRMAISDLNLFTSYDQRGGAFHNQVNAGLSFQLPIWNRNQGNIKTAKFQVKAREYDAESLKIKLMADIYNSYSLYNQSVIEFQKVNKLYNNDFEISFNGISENFRKGNVSIVEFLDFFESYNNALLEISRVRVQLKTSAELINLTIGKDIF